MQQCKKDTAVYSMGWTTYVLFIDFPVNQSNDIHWHPILPVRKLRGLMLIVTHIDKWIKSINEFFGWRRYNSNRWMTCLLERTLVSAISTALHYFSFFASRIFMKRSPQRTRQTFTGKNPSPHFASFNVTADFSNFNFHWIVIINHHWPLLTRLWTIN